MKLDPYGGPPEVVMEKQRVAQGLGVVGVLFGVAAWVAPGWLSGLYGLENSPSTRMAARLFASRNLALGVSGLRASNNADRNKVLALTVGISGLDVLSALVGRRTNLPDRAVAPLVVTSGSIAVAAASARAVM
jgi:hypothetical protein